MEIWSRQLKITWEAHARRWRVKPVVQRVQSVNWLTRNSGLHLNQLRVNQLRVSRKIPLFSWNTCPFVFSSHVLYIPLLPAEIVRSLLRERAYWEKNPKRGFYNTPTLLERESYPFFERNFCRLLSFPFPLLYSLRGDLYLNTTHTHSKCCECF